MVEERIIMDSDSDFVSDREMQVRTTIENYVEGQKQEISQKVSSEIESVRSKTAGGRVGQLIDGVLNLLDRTFKGLL